MKRTIVVEPNKRTQDAVISFSSKILNIRIVCICSDLTSAFDEIEHRPPDIVLISRELVALQEFQSMERLLKLMDVKWLRIVNDTTGLGYNTSRAELAGVLDFNLASSRQEALAALRAATTETTPLTARPRARSVRSVHNDQRIFLIGSSTGGVDALLKVLGGFPANCPPTLIVQHTGPTFSASLARLLDNTIAPKVREAKSNDKIQQGTILIAPGTDCHLVLSPSGNRNCVLKPGETISGHRPSIDALFRSALPYANHVTATILTGMGKDGAAGLLELRNAGAMTIGQDKKTSVVYGMPRQAAEIGAVRQELPLNEIGQAMLNPISVGGVAK